MNFDKKQPHTLEFRWGTSRGRDTYGYKVCTLYVDRERVARCNGGGYDMKGTNLGTFIAGFYAPELLKLRPSNMPKQSHWQPDPKARVCWNLHEGPLKTKLDKCPKCGEETEIDHRAGERIDEGRYFYGLVYHDPNFDASRDVPPTVYLPADEKDDKGKTVGELENEGKSLGLERLQSVYRASSKHPTKRHTVPDIDGGCGFSSVETIMRAIGLELVSVLTRGNSVDVYTLMPIKKSKKN